MNDINQFGILFRKHLGRYLFKVKIGRVQASDSSKHLSTLILGLSSNVTRHLGTQTVANQMNLQRILFKLIKE